MTTMYQKIIEPTKLIYGGTYEKIRKELIEGKRDLCDAEFGSYNRTPYSVDFTLRDYDGRKAVDYDVYDLIHRDQDDEPSYFDGGLLFNVADLPETEEEFWDRAVPVLEEYLEGLKKTE